MVRTRNVGLHVVLCCSSHDWRSCVCALEQKRVGCLPPTPARPRQRDRDIIVVVFLISRSAALPSFTFQTESENNNFPYTGRMTEEIRSRAGRTPHWRGSWLDDYAGGEIAMTVKMTLMSQRGSAPHSALKLLGPLRHARGGIHLPAPIPLLSPFNS